MDIFGLNFRKDVILQFHQESVSVTGMTCLTVNVKTTGTSYNQDNSVFHTNCVTLLSFYIN